MICTGIWATWALTAQIASLAWNVTSGACTPAVGVQFCRRRPQLPPGGKLASKRQAFYSPCAGSASLVLQRTAVYPQLHACAMAAVGFSPSVRLFEAGACGIPVISDAWEGLDTFFAPGDEILVAASAAEVTEILLDMPETERAAIGARARAAVLARHTAAHRALELESYIRRDRRALHRFGQSAAALSAARSARAWILVGRRLIVKRERAVGRNSRTQVLRLIQRPPLAQVAVVRRGCRYVTTAYGASHLVTPESGKRIENYVPRAPKRRQCCSSVLPTVFGRR